MLNSLAFRHILLCQISIRCVPAPQWPLLSLPQPCKVTELSAPSFIYIDSDCENPAGDDVPRLIVPSGQYHFTFKFMVPSVSPVYLMRGSRYIVLYDGMLLPKSISTSLFFVHIPNLNVVYDYRINAAYRTFEFGQIGYCLIAFLFQCAHIVAQ